MKEILYNSPPIIRNLGINLYGRYLYHKRFNKTYHRYFEYLLNNLNKSAEEIRAEQFTMLKRTLIYSYENINYYKKVFDEVRFVPYEFSDTKQLELIPLLTKEIIRENFDDLHNHNVKSNSYIKHSTSGSTGTKLNFILPKELAFSKNAAFHYRLYSFLGVRLGDRRVTLGGRIFTNKPPFWTFNKAENQLLLSSHHLNKSTVVDYIQKIEDFKPIFIQGHPNSILVLANEILSRGYRIGFDLKGIFTTGETLIKANKGLIESAFNTTVLQQYGSGENCFSAQETPENEGYMINYEHGFVELLGERQTKEVVATSFLNTVMPFIRYQVGDLVKPTIDNRQKCAFPVLFDEVIGRTDDIITDNKGENILPVTIRMNLKEIFPEHTNYQLIQVGIDKYKMMIVDNERRINVKTMLKRLHSILGEPCEIEIKYVDEIITPGGKIRNVINRVSG